MWIVYAENKEKQFEGYIAAFTPYNIGKIELPDRIAVFAGYGLVNDPDDSTHKFTYNGWVVRLFWETYETPYDLTGLADDLKRSQDKLAGLDLDFMERVTKSYLTLRGFAC